MRLSKLKALFATCFVMIVGAGRVARPESSMGVSGCFPKAQFHS